MYRPDGSFDHVLVRAKRVYGEGYTWTSGLTTGKTGKHGEHFEVTTDSPLVEPDKAMYHYEDIKEPEE